MWATCLCWNLTLTNNKACQAQLQSTLNFTHTLCCGYKPRLQWWRNLDPQDCQSYHCISVTSRQGCRHHNGWLVQSLSAPLGYVLIMTNTQLVRPISPIHHSAMGIHKVSLQYPKHLDYQGCLSQSSRQQSCLQKHKHAVDMAIQLMCFSASSKACDFMLLKMTMNNKISVHLTHAAVLQAIKPSLHSSISTADLRMVKSEQPR